MMAPIRLSASGATPIILSRARYSEDLGAHVRERITNGEESRVEIGHLRD